MDVYDLDTYQRGIPHDVFARLRQECPVYFNPEPAGRGFWAITKHADIAAIGRDPKTFSSARGGTSLIDVPPEELSWIQLLLLNMDPPKHTQFRNLLSRGFTPKMTSHMEPFIRAATHRVLDAVVKRGECDFLRDVAAELPLIVLADLLGIDQSDRAKVFDWSNRLIGFDDPELASTPEDAKSAATELWMYANALAEQRRKSPLQDLTSVLVHAQVDGQKLSESEFECFFLLLAVAGNETTRSAIAGGMLALIEHPEQRQRLENDPGLIPLGVEEMLRWVSPVLQFRRTATRDVELRGQTIKEGDKVVLFYCSGNRDEEVFNKPFQLDVSRDPNPHIAFGMGQHYCMGNSLARLELRIVFEEILRRMPDIRLSGDVRRLRSNFVNGIKSMPVTFRAEGTYNAS